VIFTLLNRGGSQGTSEEVKLESIRCLRVIFAKMPYLVIKAYDSGFDFQVFFDAVKDADPEMALTGIDFWDSFIMLETVVFKEEFKRKLFDQ
jgi:hypothetical protein